MQHLFVLAPYGCPCSYTSSQWLVVSLLCAPMMAAAYFGAILSPGLALAPMIVGIGEMNNAHNVLQMLIYLTNASFNFFLCVSHPSIVLVTHEQSLPLECMCSHTARRSCQRSTWALEWPSGRQSFHWQGSSWGSSGLICLLLRFV